MTLNRVEKGCKMNGLAQDISCLSSQPCLSYCPFPSVLQVKLQAKILIVDDDPINLSILEDLLHSAGCYETVTAASGTEALEVYMTLDPPAQLVLLDVTLPDMSGHEVGEEG